ncbi:MAG TPA: PAS domain-containing protein [Geminicoccaceae bacterium]|nr:PAS domain-containing protein [Geminicoccaceae bacterium]
MTRDQSAAAAAEPGPGLDEVVGLPDGVLDLLPAAIYVCDASGVIVRFNARAAELWGRAPRVGDTDQRFCGSFRLFRLDGDPLPHAATPMAEVLATGVPARDREVIIERPDGTRVAALVNIDPLRRGDGTLAGAINCFQDITGRAHAEEALRRSEQRFRDFAAAASDWFWETDAGHRFVWFSPNVEDLVGVPREWHYGKTRLELMAPGTDPAVVEAHRRTLDAHEPFREFEYLRRGPKGDTWLSTSGVPLFDARGRFQGYRGVSRDVTEKRRAEEQRVLLLTELSHRVRNTLAVVQAFAERTGARATTVPAFLDAFRGRLRALATGHTLLTEGGWRAAGFADLARATLEAYLAETDGRVRLEVEDVALRPPVALTLALALHELATNACKYGALSVPGGRVALTARVERGGGGDELRVTWRERGGPPVRPPTHTGFGTSLLVEAIEYQHDGRAELDWREEGLVYRLGVRLAEAAPPPTGPPDRPR